VTRHSFTAWFTTYPRGHELHGQTVEVVPRLLLEEMTMRHVGSSGTRELEDLREGAAVVIESAARSLEATGDDELASELRLTMLRLMELATREPS
jgi:hypothetical protein